MFNKVVIIGSNGLVGTELMKVFPSAIGLTHSDIEIENIENVKICINNLKPDLIIMGSNGKDSIVDYILGTTTDFVVDNSKIPVLVIPNI